MDGTTPAKVPDPMIAEIRSRECKGAVWLASKLRPGQIGCVLAIYAGMSGRDRVAVLLRLLGGEHRTLMHSFDVEI